MKIISRSMDAVVSFMTVDGALLFGLVVLAVGFKINLILSLCCCGYKKRIRRWFLMTALTVLAFETAVALHSGANGATVAVYIVFALPAVYFSFLLKEKKRKIKSEHLELAKYFDDKAGRDEPVLLDGEELAKINAKDFPQKNVCAKNLADGQAEEVKPSPITPSKVKEIFEEKRKSEFGLDFSHVKNVLSRLDYFSLSPADKRQVKELEITLCEAESGEFSPQLKSRLNDGLGALLKIMSKHGV